MKIAAPQPSANEELEAPQKTYDAGGDIFSAGGGFTAPGKADRKGFSKADSDVLEALGGGTAVVYAQDVHEYDNGVLTAKDIHFHKGGFQLRFGNTENFEAFVNVEGAVASEANPQQTGVDAKLGGEVGISGNLGTFRVTGTAYGDLYSMDRELWTDTSYENGATQEPESHDVGTHGFGLRLDKTFAVTEETVIPTYVELNLDTGEFDSLLATVGASKTWTSESGRVSFQAGASATMALNEGELVEDIGMVGAQLSLGGVYRLPINRGQDYDAIEFFGEATYGYNFQDTAFESLNDDPDTFSVMFGLRYRL